MHKLKIDVLGLLFVAVPLTLSGSAASHGGTLMLSPSPTAARRQNEGTTSHTREAPQVAVSYRLANNRLTLNEPVILEFRVENGLARPISLDLGADSQGAFLFTIKQPDGTRVQLPPLRRGGLAFGGEVAIKPGQSYTHEILLNEGFDFAVPGEYEIEARLTTTIQDPEGQSVAEKTESHTALKIGPRDVERLNSVCAALATQIINAGSCEEAARAALTLSYVKDPVAVPYLESALKSGRLVEPIVIAGLERTGGEKAIQVLTSASADQDSDIAMLAQSALNRVKKGSTGRLRVMN